ncbi:MAG: hypothetical protein JST54_23100 [Deltaproteobacteria bacterium]|nr:hypothetical protein [Deltaproteobacteria bacterium]
MRRWVISSLVLAGASHAAAKPMMPPEPAPMARALNNVERYVKAHPDDEQGHFTLGRLHLLTYGGETDVRLIGGEKQTPYLYFDDPGRGAPPGKGPAAELDAAIAELERAVKLDANDVRPQVSLAWALEERAARSPNHEGAADALAAWRKVFARTKVDDAHPARGIGPDLDLEAADGIARLLAGKSDAASQKELAELKAYRDKTEKAPRAISPVVVLLDGSDALVPHVDSQAHRHFDLDGLDRNRAWPWLRPTAAFLAWDPDGCGRIRDGRQLFGNVTWWGLWRDGYEPLALLDDDGDGALSGDELAGLVLWTDQNSDGVSDSGEVLDVRAAGVVRIQVSPDGVRDGVTWQRAGVTMRNGKKLATYDWTPQSLSEPKVSVRP